MAGGISSVLSQAKSALGATQVAMNTTAKNVANVNTDGYSRQRVDFKSGLPENYGPHRMGGGVDIKSVQRSTNDFVNSRLISEQSDLGKYQGLADIYSQLEMVFKEDGEGSISSTVSQFFNNMRTLSTQPDSVPLRTAVRESAKGVVHRFQTMSESIDQVSQDVDHRLEGAISDINRLTERISSLNTQIINVELGNVAARANDERDQRDMALSDLSKLVDVQVTELENGGINVSTGTMGPLVMGADHQSLGAYRSSDENNANTVKVFLLSPNEGTPPKDVTHKFESGQVAGLVQLRDSIMPGFRGQIDGLAYNLTSEVNAVHESAFTHSGQKGLSFFADNPSVNGAAGRMRLSDAVESNVANIATSDMPNAAGDNRALLRMTDLETAKIFNGGQSNFNDVSSSIIGSLGVQIRSANDSLMTQQGVVEQLDTLKKTASAVSLDEEAMNMMKFQKAFDASAKMIQVADQMMDTVINLKRM